MSQPPGVPLATSPADPTLPSPRPPPPSSAQPLGLSAEARASAAACMSERDRELMALGAGCGGPAGSDVTGWLYKESGNINKNWKRRWFVMHDNVLSYFKSPQEMRPIGVIPLSGTKIEAPDYSTGKRHCIKMVPQTAISTFKRWFGTSPNVYVHAENQQDMERWLAHIKRSRTRHGSRTCEDAFKIHDPIPESCTCIKEGYLIKRGHVITTWTRRWFVLEPGSLKYYETPHDLHPRGVINLQEAEVAPDFSRGKRFCFYVKTRSRTDYLYASDQPEMDEWMSRIINNFRPPGWRADLEANAAAAAAADAAAAAAASRAQMVEALSPAPLPAELRAPAAADAGGSTDDLGAGEVAISVNSHINGVQFIVMVSGPLRPARFEYGIDSEPNVQFGTPGPIDGGKTVTNLIGPLECSAGKHVFRMRYVLENGEVGQIHSAKFNVQSMAVNFHQISNNSGSLCLAVVGRPPTEAYIFNYLLDPASPNAPLTEQHHGLAFSVILLNDLALGTHKLRVQSSRDTSMEDDEDAEPVMSEVIDFEFDVL